ncbi:MAG: DUF4115 domain-containing protein [Parvibaculaceae bacterium]|nr:DUF4115 domain-containing protein [Parvibaculaceae bacterium]
MESSIERPRLVATQDLVGYILRDTRKRRRETVADIAAILRIKAGFLEAIEDCRYGDLPGVAYVRGFVRHYADYLGLDADTLIARLEQEVRLSVADRAPGLIPPALKRELPRGGFILAGLVTLVTLFGSWLIAQSGNRPVDLADNNDIAAQVAAQATGASSLPHVPRFVSGHPDLAGDAASASTANMAVAAFPVAPVVSPVTGEVKPASLPNSGLVPGMPHLNDAASPAVTADFATAAEVEAAEAEIDAMPVTIRATRDNAWLRVEDPHGRVLVERTFAAGESYSVPDRPGLIMVARDGAAFELLVQGQSVGLAGPRGVALTGEPIDPRTLLRTARN